MSWFPSEADADDEASRSSLMCDDISASNVSSKALTASPHIDIDVGQFNDMDTFLELVELHMQLITSYEEATREDGWRRVQSDGLLKGADWAEAIMTDCSEAHYTRCIWKSLLQTITCSRREGSSIGMSKRMHRDIVAFLRSGTYPDFTDSNKKSSLSLIYMLRNWRNKCTAYYIGEDGLLMYARQGIPKIVLLEGEVEHVIRSAHRQLGHAGYKVTAEYVSRRFHGSTDLCSVSRMLVDGCSLGSNEVSLKCVRSRKLTPIFKRDHEVELPSLHISGIETTNASDTCKVLDSSSNSHYLKCGMGVKLYKTIVDCLNNKQAAGEPGCRSENDRKYLRSYKISDFGLVKRLSNRIVLSEEDAPNVLEQLHSIYGHPSDLLIKSLVNMCFIMNGAQGANAELIRNCSFCRLKKNHKKFTAGDFCKGANYTVSVAWEGDRRVFTIHPIGLDRETVEKYVRDTTEELGGLPDERPAKGGNSVIDQLSIKVDRLKKLMQCSSMTQNRGTFHSFAKSSLAGRTDTATRSPKSKLSPDHRENMENIGVHSILKRGTGSRKRKRAPLRVRWSLAELSDSEEPSSRGEAGWQDLSETGNGELVNMEVEHDQKAAEYLNDDNIWSDSEEPSSLRSHCDSEFDQTHSIGNTPSQPLEDTVASLNGTAMCDDSESEFSDVDCDKGTSGSDSPTSTPAEILPVQRQADFEPKCEPRAWQWEDMQEDEVYAFQERMAARELVKQQLEHRRLNHEVATLQVDRMKLQLMDTFENASGAKVLETNVAETVEESEVIKIDTSTIVCDTDAAYRDSAIADPWLFEQPAGYSQTAIQHGYYQWGQPENPFDLATGRNPPGYNVWNGIAYPLNPGPIANPYAEVNVLDNLVGSKNCVDDDDDYMESEDDDAIDNIDSSSPLSAGDSTLAAASFDGILVNSTEMTSQ